MTMPGNDQAFFVDTVSGTGGGTGTATDPVDTLAAAHALAVAQGRRRIHISRGGFLALPALDWTRFTISGDGGRNGGANGAPIIDLNSQNPDGAVFYGLIMFGTQGGTGFWHAYSCQFFLMADIRCFGFESYFSGNNGVARALVCFRSQSETAVVPPPALDFTNQDGSGGKEHGLQDFSGPLTLTNITDAGIVVDISGSAIDITIDSTCTAGTVRLRGSGKVTDNSTGSLTLDTTGLVQPQAAGESAARPRIMARREGTTDVVVLAWLESNGALDKSATAGTLTIRDENDTILAGPTVVASPQAGSGAFKFTETGLTFPSGSDTLLNCEVSITDAASNVRTSSTILAVTA